MHIHIMIWDTIMIEHPVYVRIPTENEVSYFASRSCAEAVINVLITAQRLNWLRLHGFVVMPEAVEMVATPIRQGIAGVVGNLQAETIPQLAILLPQAGMIWARRFTQIPLTSQRALEARLNMMLLVPVANGICEHAADYPFSSANPRYASSVIEYSGFIKPAQKTASLPTVLNAGRTNSDAPIITRGPIKELP